MAFVTPESSLQDTASSGARDGGQGLTSGADDTRLAWLAAALRRDGAGEHHGLLAVRFALLNVACGALLVVAYMHGLVDMVIAADKTGLSVGIFAVFVVVWVVLVVYPAVTRVEYPAFTMVDFDDVIEIQEVVAKPPALYVTVDAGLWKRMDAEKRLDLVRMVGQKLSAAGYMGANFTNGEGRTVAQWMKKTGASLTPDPA